MAQSAPFDDWDDEDEDFVPQGAPKAGIVAAATTNIIAGALALMLGFFLAVQGVDGFNALADSPLSGKVTFVRQDVGKDLGKDVREKVGRVSSVVASPLALAMMLFGVGAIVAGVGVAKRLNWGRGLSMALAVAGTILGLLFLLLPPLLLPFVVVFGAHALVIRLVLIDKDYVYQFR